MNSERRVVEDAPSCAVEELCLREALQRVVEAAREVEIRERQRAVLRDRRGVEAELLVAEHVAEGDLRAAEEVAAARHAERSTGGRPSRNIFSNVPFLRLLSRDERVAERRLEVDDRSGRAEVGRRRPSTIGSLARRACAARTRPCSSVTNAILRCVAAVAAARPARQVAARPRRCTAAARRSSGRASRCCRCCRCAPRPGRSAASGSVAVDVKTSVSASRNLRGACRRACRTSAASSAGGEVELEQLVVAADARACRRSTCRRARTSARSRRTRPS